VQIKVSVVYTGLRRAGGRSQLMASEVVVRSAGASLLLIRGAAEQKRLGAPRHGLPSTPTNQPDVTEAGARMQNQCPIHHRRLPGDSRHPPADYFQRAFRQLLDFSEDFACCYSNRSKHIPFQQVVTWYKIIQQRATYQ